MPAGSADGGQWTDGGGGGSASPGLVRVGARGRGFIATRVGRHVQVATHQQAARLAIANARANAAAGRVRTVDPSWRPRPSLTDPNSVEGQIRRFESEAREAESRLNELARARFGDNKGPLLDPIPIPPTASLSPPRTAVAPPEAIASYRAVIGMPSVPNGRASALSEGTVAFADVDGQPVFGVNSNAPGYTVRDETMAQQIRDKLIALHPDIMATGNIGYKPNDALFHAEANALLRAADLAGGSLAGRTIDMRVDRRLCRSCEVVMPVMALQIGNPTLRITDGVGQVFIIQGGFLASGGRR